MVRGIRSKKKKKKADIGDDGSGLQETVTTQVLATLEQHSQESRWQESRSLWMQVNLKLHTGLELMHFASHSRHC